MTDPNRVTSIPLPAGAEPPIRVYVNGEEWTEGEDFHIEGGHVHFARVLRARPKMGFGRSVMLAIGIGVYGDLKGDTLDLQYTSGGRLQMTPIPLRPGGS